jgi:nitrogen-specific signal transduction histidine kinase
LKQPVWWHLTATTPGYGDNMVIGISDAGDGTAKQVVDGISAPFFSTKRNRFAMGLTLAEQTAARPRGEINVESGPGKDTTCVMIVQVSWMKKYLGARE